MAELKKGHNPKKNKASSSWSDDDRKRLYETFDISVYGLSKPQEIKYLYKVNQRLSAQRLRMLEGPPKDKHTQTFLEVTPPLSPEDCAFLHEVIHAVLNGERDAFKAFQLKTVAKRLSEMTSVVIAAEYELYCREAPGKQTPWRDLIAKRWDITGSRVSTCRSKHKTEINAWIENALKVTAEEGIPSDLVIRVLLDKVFQIKDEVGMSTSSLQKRRSGGNTPCTPDKLNQEWKDIPEQTLGFKFPIQIKKK
jgi:hypothetical protein